SMRRPPLCPTPFPYTTLFRSAPASGAMHAARPAQFNHRAQRDIRISEIPDSFDQGLRLSERGFGLHATEDRSLRPLSQVYYYPKDRKSTRLNSSHSQISYAVF